jgi:hypothetical protein
MSSDSSSDSSGRPEQPSPKPPDGGTVTVAPYVPEGVPVLFADGLFVTLSSGVWRLSFTRAEFPLATGTPPPEIPARCVAQVIVANERMPAFLGVLWEQAEKAGFPVRVQREAEEEASDAG